MSRGIFRVFVATAFLGCGAALAQDRGTMEPRTMAPLADPSDPRLPGKAVFGRDTEPAAMAPQMFGFYAKECIAGARPIPVDGPVSNTARG